MGPPTKSLLLVFLALAGAAAPSGQEALRAPQPKSGQEAPRAPQPKNTTRPHRQRPKKTGAESVVEAAPKPVPIPAMAPEELPAGAPRVTYLNGRLSVDSNNSTLDQILKAIGAETGAEIEALPNTSGERVAAHLAGPPRKVIAALLDGANFGYVIQSSASDPDAVVRVVLTNQTQNDARPAPAAFSGRRLGAVSQVEASPSVSNSAASTPGPDRTAEPDSQTQPPSSNASATANGVAPPVAGGGPSENAVADSSTPPTPAQRPGEGQQPSQNAPFAQPQGKTPAEILQEMYRQRQQLQPQNQQPKPQNE
jgi:hypothetical protein